MSYCERVDFNIKTCIKEDYGSKGLMIAAMIFECLNFNSINASYILYSIKVPFVSLAYEIIYYILGAVYFLFCVILPSIKLYKYG